MVTVVDSLCPAPSSELAVAFMALCQKLDKEWAGDSVMAKVGGTICEGFPDF